MRSLTEKFNELRGILKTGLGSIRPTGFDPVYYLIFPPEQILEVKLRIPAWDAQLRIDGFTPHVLSITKVINDYFRAHPLREVLIEAASLQNEDYPVITGSIAQHLEQDRVIDNAILEAIESHKNDSSSVLIITDLESLHPFLRIGAVEQRLSGQFAFSTVVLYPGSAGGLYSRRFLGIHKEDGNYRSPHID